MQNKVKGKHKKKVNAPFTLSQARQAGDFLLPNPLDMPPVKPQLAESKSVVQKRSELIRFIQNENGQHYIFNGKSIKSYYEAKYSAKSPKGDFRFILPMEISLHFPDIKRFHLETLEWEPIEPISTHPPLLNAQRRSTEIQNIDPSLIEYPYVHNFGKIKILAKKDSGDLKASVLSYITTCHNQIKEQIESSLELVSSELEDHSIFALIDFGTSLESMLHQKTTDRYPSRQEFPDGPVYEEWIEEVDKYLVEVYNEGMCDELNPSWLRFRVDCLGRAGVETLACVLVRRLTGFCKVKLDLTNAKIENMQLSPLHTEYSSVLQGGL